MFCFSWNICFTQNADCATDLYTNQTFGNSSGLCSDIDAPYFTHSIDPNYLASFPEKTIQVYFWAINRSDGSSDNPFTTQKLEESMDLLNSAYAEMNLCFELKGYQEINEDSIYFNNIIELKSYVDQNPNHRDESSVNIYIPYRFTTYNNGLRGFFFGYEPNEYNKMAVNSYEYNTGIFIHEMGHLLSLRHTFTNNGPSCERVTRDPNNPNYNATTAGDRVVDTEAFLDMNNNTALINNNCAYIGPTDWVDCVGTPFQFGENEIKNYMSYTLQHCRDRFTVGQGIRVREYLDNCPLTQNYLSDYSEDLYSLNSLEDIGTEPDIFTEVIWESPDIWARNQPDGFTIQEHQDLEYINDNTPVYIYVKVRNRGCGSSGGNDQLELYWAKGGLSQTWPNVWTGLNNDLNGLEIGNLVGSNTIPSLGSGEETILEYQWQPRNPTAYENNGFNKPWMFCFLTRLVSDEDLPTGGLGSSAADNTRNNNDMVYKNTTTVNLSNSSALGTLTVGNFSLTNSLKSNINFFTNQDNLIWQEAEIRVKLDETLWNAWQNSGAQSTNLRVINATNRVIYLHGNNASLDNIVLQPNEWGRITPRINFLIREVTNEIYTLHVSQTESVGGDVLGGFTYHIQRDFDRQYFIAEANLTNNTQNTTLYAESINENATYNWYDEEGNFISSGESLTITNSDFKNYKLEVIADSDGHKDYKTFTVKENRSITSLTPNPTYNDFTVHYFIGNANTAFLKVTNVITGVENNYLLDLNTNHKELNLSNQASGQYVVNLVTDNIIVDTKNLIKY